MNGALTVIYTVTATIIYVVGYCVPCSSHVVSYFVPYRLYSIEVIFDFPPQFLLYSMVRYVRYMYFVPYNPYSINNCGNL